MEATRRVSKDNISNPFREDFPFDILEVGDTFELQPISKKGLDGAKELTDKYSVNGKKFIYFCSSRFIEIKRTA